MDNEALKTAVMKRVYYVHMMRKIYHSSLTKVAVVALSLGVTTFFISFKNVLNNTPQLTDFSALYGFYSYAFMHTEFLVKALVALVFVGIVMLLKDVFVGLSSFRHSDQAVVKV